MFEEARFKSAGSELKGMLQNLGFPDQVGNLYGTALDAAIGSNTGAARSLLDAYEPLAIGAQLERLTTRMTTESFVPSPRTHFSNGFGMLQGYLGPMPAAFPTPAQIPHIINSLLNRLSPQSFLPVIHQMNHGAPIPPNQSIPESIGKTFEQIIASLEGKIETKLDAEANAPVKKKKKKGGLKKMKKSLTKKMKSAAKFAKKTFKDLTKPIQKSLTSFLKVVNTGNFAEFGRALTGGLIGGPVGGLLLENLMKIGGKNNPLQQAVKQFHGTFDLVANLQKHQTDLQQRSLSTKFLR